jgi:porin
MGLKEFVAAFAVLLGLGLAVRAQEPAADSAPDAAVKPAPNNSTPNDAGKVEAPALQPPAGPKPPAKQKDAGKAKEAKKGDTAAKQEKKEEHEPADPDTGSSTLSPETLGLLPNPYERLGIKFTLSYVGDALANIDGGLRRGAVYEGRLNGAIDLDLAKLAGARGLSVHVNAFEIHGPALSRDYIGNLMPVSSLEAQATVRLYEAWFEQKFWNDKFSVRAGQLAADAEFITSKYADPFIAATYGWPAITALDLPSGGPSPPLAAMGVRVKAEFNENFTALAAVFDGDAAGPGTDDPQSRNRYGLNFRVNDPPLVIGEVQYAYNQEKTSAGLPGTVKLGGWFHAGQFNDQRFAANGLSLAAPGASATPAQLTGDYGVYSVFEQMLVAFAGRESPRGVGVFTRASFSPGDRNLIDFYADGGIVATGPLASRPADKIGLAAAYARISQGARALDRDFETLDNDPRPVRSAETLVTATYSAEIKKGWTVIPTLQYVIRPGGGYVTEGGAAMPLKNATVFGARTVVKF